MGEIYFSHDTFRHLTKKAKCHENTQEILNNDKFKIFRLLIPLLWHVININAMDPIMVGYMEKQKMPVLCPYLPQFLREAAPYI